MPDREYGGGDYNSGYGGGYSAPDNPRAGDTPGFGTGGGGSVGGGGGYGVDVGGGLARGDGGRNDYMDQGRGSNVTDNQPQSPADSIRYGMAPRVEAPVVPVSVPIFAQYNMTPNTVGMPSIMAGIQPPPMQITPTTEAMRPTGYIMPDIGVKLNKYDISPTMGVETGPQRRGVPMSAVRDNFEYMNRPVINKFLDKTRVVESNDDPNAQSKTSSAGGLFQFIDSTWLSTVQKNRPDLFDSYTPQQILDMKYDPVLSTEMARALAVDNAMALKANNLPITERNLYLEHFLGSGAAIKALKSDPNAPISDIVSDKAVKANQSLLGEGKTVADILNWTGSQMSRPTYAGAGSKSYINEAGAPADIFRGTPATSAQGGEGFAVPGGQQTAAQAASSSPQNFGDWLSGLFDTSARVKQLESQGRTSTYPGEDASNVKQRYADQFTGGDVNKVQSRIVDFGQGPVVDYYAKDLGTAIMEGFASPFKAVGDMFSGKGIESLPQGSSVRDRKFMDLFSQNVPSRGYGPNGDLTFEEYRQIYGR
jgi:hypothetical protein